ncbi:MAG: BrnT family toxin [Candidatus Anammoxibacter sp.]
MKLIFEWNEEKAKENFRKHKISFEEAKTIFSDPFLTTYPDRLHSNNEQRYINIGVSRKGRVLILIHTERGKYIRIISCRKATRNERRTYEEEF